MPVHIRDLVIVAHITEGSSKKENTASAEGQSAGPGGLNEEIKLRIIEEAVTQVMEILERQKDR